MMCGDGHVVAYCSVIVVATMVTWACQHYHIRSDHTSHHKQQVTSYNNGQLRTMSSQLIINTLKHKGHYEVMSDIMFSNITRGEEVRL